jgi:hypothetical protein
MHLPWLHIASARRAGGDAEDVADELGRHRIGPKGPHCTAPGDGLVGFALDDRRPVSHGGLLVQDHLSSMVFSDLIRGFHDFLSATPLHSTSEPIS